MFAQLTEAFEVAQYGAPVIVSGAFLYILYWLLNRLTTTIDNSVRTVNKAIIHNNIILVGVLDSIVSLQQQLLIHDMNMSFAHPKKEDIDGKAERVIKKFNDLQNIIENTQRSVKEINEAIRKG